MKQILAIESSPMESNSTTRALTKEFLAQAQAKYPQAKVTIRDLSKNPLPHLGQETVSAFFTPPDSRSSGQQEAIKLSDSITDELLASDTIVIGAPMWNFSVPSVLKAWIDHIVRAGRTFSFSEKGLQGLAAGKKVYVLTASGSNYKEGPFKPYDFVEPYLRTVLGFIGITDVTFIKTEGLNDPAIKAAAPAVAADQIASSII